MCKTRIHDTDKREREWEMLQEATGEATISGALDVATNNTNRSGLSVRSSETPTHLEYIEYNMSSSIRISDETKKKLELMKREDETYDELLSRLATTEKDIQERGGFADDNVVEDMARAREEMNESLDARSNRQA